MVMLAATTAERTHREHAAQAVVDTGSMIAAIADGHIGRGDVAQRTHIGHHGCSEGVQSHIFAMVGP